MTLYFYLARHGQTELNKENKLQGAIDSPLTPEGIRGAKNLGKSLSKINFIAGYSSDQKRAVDTMKYIADENEHQFPIQQIAGLREAYFGSFEGKHLSSAYLKILRTYGTRMALDFANKNRSLMAMLNGLSGVDQTHLAENFEEVTSRAVDQMRKLAYQYQNNDGNILIVSHALLLSSFIYYLDQNILPPTMLKNSSYSIVKYENNQFVIEKINQL